MKICSERRCGLKLSPTSPQLEQHHTKIEWKLSVLNRDCQHEECDDVDGESMNGADENKSEMVK